MKNLKTIVTPKNFERTVNSELYSLDIKKLNALDNNHVYNNYIAKHMHSDKVSYDFDCNSFDSNYYADTHALNKLVQVLEILSNTYILVESDEEFLDAKELAIETLKDFYKTELKTEIEDEFSGGNFLNDNYEDFFEEACHTILNNNIVTQETLDEEKFNRVMIELSTERIAEHLEKQKGVISSYDIPFVNYERDCETVFLTVSNMSSKLFL